MHMRLTDKERHHKFHPRNVMRWVKYKYLLLRRAKGGPSKVAKGFSIGLAIEMFTLPTAGAAFFLIFPFAYLFRGSVAGALIGFLFGKLIYIPMSFLNEKVGRLLLPKHVRQTVHEQIPDWLSSYLKLNLKLLVGGIVVGTVIGLLLYYPVKWTLELQDAKRKQKRSMRKEQLLISSEPNS
jgi:uncharacterized protein (DUF2062 family)